MVLAAAPKQAMVWGFAKPGSAVSVRFNGADLEATVGPDQVGSGWMGLIFSGRA